MLDEKQATRLIAAQLPQLRGLVVEHEAEGQDHQVFAAGENWLVRFPKRHDRVAWLEREVKILAIVHDVIPEGVPRPELIARPSDAYAFPFFAHRRIPGVAADLSPVADPDGLADDVGRLLAALHGVETTRIPPTPAGWERLTLDEERTELQGLAGAVARPLRSELATLAEPYLAGRMPAPSSEATLRFVHNDICPDHPVVDPQTGRLSGLIDFADAMVNLRHVRLDLHVG